GGQRQRVALARALVKQPRLLLLDESLAALDRQLRETTRLELVRIQRELGTTFVMVTHDQEEALSLATRIGVMADGRLLQSGAPHDVYERPANRFVAEFVGNANLLEVDVTTHDDAGVLLGSDLCSTPLRAAAASATRAGRAWLLLRPEQVTLAHADVPTAGVGDNALAGVIEDIAYGGDRWVYAIRLANGVRWRVSEPNAAHRAHADLTRGVAVTLRWPPGCGVVLAQ
ncbi:MAG: ABC transporter ATP-binding protein, partial [Gammaproteobacteria bacterium]